MSPSTFLISQVFADLAKGTISLYLCEVLNILSSADRGYHTRDILERCTSA